jgi:cob(I)alamin adenosyltransferase
MTKIYTKTGDKGTSSLLGGTRVPKYHIRLECYGTIDELNSHIGLIRDSIQDTGVIDLLSRIQHTLFKIGSHLANENPDTRKTPVFSEKDITILEQAIDAYTKELPVLQNFILPGGHTVASYCHIARTVCRRAERAATKLAEEVSFNEQVITYINRLSDYLFVLARKMLKDFNKSEITWNPIL